MYHGMSHGILLGEVERVKRRGRQRFAWLIWLGPVSPLMFPGCSATLPQINPLTKSDAPASAPVQVADSPAAARTEASPAETSGQLPPVELEPPPTGPPEETVIVGFRTATVILYDSPQSNQGERVPAASLPLPLRTRFAAPASMRVEIKTIYGPRWIARADAAFAPPPLASPVN